MKRYLYVILLPQMDENRNLGYMVKFGYTKNFKKRMETGYKTYHRCVEVLHLYNGDFTKRDETQIKQYLRKYIIFKKEYFKFCPEVLDFFNTYNTPEKLKNKIDTLPLKIPEDKTHNVNFHIIEFIISKTFPKLTEFFSLQKKRDELYKELKSFSEEEQIKVACSKYSIIKEEIESYLESKKSKLDSIADNIKDLALKFNKLKDSCKKLTMLVGLENIDGITKHDINSFLELIHPKYREYYTVMGPKFIRQFSCKEADIKHEWAKLKSNDDIKDKINQEIYKLFKIGNRYTKIEIKSSLNKLYSQLNYQKKAKSTDLESLFIMKPILTPDKKAGFEIVGKK